MAEAQAQAKPSILIRPVSTLGAITLGLLAAFGQFWRFTGQTLAVVFCTAWWRWRNVRLLTPQFFAIGTCSVPVILVTGAFNGMVLAVQAYEQFAAAGLVERLGVIVNVSVLRELGPVLAGVMIAGRVGGALAAELGTMRVTEQIDAVRAMGTSPIRVLVCPRFLGCVVLAPFLTLYCDILGVIGGAFITTVVYGANSDLYWGYSVRMVGGWDIATGLIKSVFFGGAISLISCYKGFNCRPGAEGVGRATTEAFVASFMAILVLDFFLALLLQSIALRLWGFESIF